MNTSRTQYILDYFYNSPLINDSSFGDRFFFLKLHALLNCLTENEIRILYLWQSNHSENFKTSLLRFIEKKCISKKMNFNQTVIDFLENYEAQPYRIQLSYRTFLSQVIKYQNLEIQEEYFNLFIKSERINDRKKAYEVAETLWTNVGKLIWEVYFKYYEEGALVQIIRNSEPRSIVENIHRIWDIEYPNNKLKKMIIEKTSSEPLSNFQFLKKSEPTFYIQALIVRKKSIDRKLLVSVSKKMIHERYGFVFYYLGLAKEWDLLTKAIDTFETGEFE